MCPFLKRVYKRCIIIGVKPGAKLAKNRDIMEIKVKWGLWAAFRASALTLFQMGKGELKLASGGQSCALSGDGMAMGWLARGWAKWAEWG